MSVIAIVNIEISDIEKYVESGYVEHAGSTVTQYGGTYLVRAGNTVVIEGDPKPARVILIEFDSMENFNKWYDSEEYAPWKKVRHRLAKNDMFVVEALSKQDRNLIASANDA